MFRGFFLFASNTTNMKKNYFSILALFVAFVSYAQQNLNPGDIIVIGYAADTGTATTAYNEFTWVPLVNLEAGTKIYFTDAGYNTIDAEFMGTGVNDEILFRYIVPFGGLAAGSVMTVTEQNVPENYTVISGTKFGNDFNSLLTLPNAGDQITVFQSSDDETIPITFGNTDFHAIFMLTGSSLSFTALTSNTANITPVSNRDNVTNLVPGLTAGQNAIAVGTGPLEADESDNARYVGITTGTREEILAAVMQLPNWARHDPAFGNDLAFGSTPNGWTTNGVSLFTIEGLGIKDSETSISVSLYPNPTNKTFSLVNESGQDIKKINLYNSNGQKVKQFTPAQNQYDVSVLYAGIYFVEIVFEKSTIIKKLIRY